MFTQLARPSPLTLWRRPSYVPFSKCLTVPHLELAVAFTGMANLGREWMQWVQSRVVAADERIYIGGELVITQLSDRKITSTKIHRFADFDERGER